MKGKLFNYLIIILLSLMIILRIVSKDIYNIYNNILYYFSIFLVIITSIYFTIKLKFIQFNVFKIIKTIRKSSKNDIKALFMSMGAKIGVGSIAGISLAIYMGGPGVILWIWIISLLSAILTYCESYLGVKYKLSNTTDKGGAFYYIKKGLSNKKLSVIYTIVLIFVYAIGFIGIQSNTIVKSVDYIVNLNHYIITIFIILSVSIIIFNKLNKIIDIMAKLVPIMCILYLILGAFIILDDNYNILSITNTIINEGLKPDKAIWSIIIIGLKRGLFATESGLGTASIASSISNNKPTNQGIFQILGAHFTSLVIVTITAFIIIGATHNYTGNINGIEIVMSIFNNYYGLLGTISLSLIIILFAISTIISGYYYGIKGIEFIKKDLSNSDYLLFKILIIILIFLGGIIESTIIWSIIDSLIITLLIINIYTIIKLRHEIK